MIDQNAWGVGRMLYFLRIATILSLGCGLSLLLRRKIETILPLCFSFIIAVLYFSGLAGNLLIGLYIVFALALASLVYTILRLPSMPKNFWHEQLLTPGCFLFIVAALLIPLTMQGRILIYWDDYSHWGLAAKNLYLLDALGNAPASTIQFQSYPPGITLLQYFFTRLDPSFSESMLFVVHNLLIIVLLLPATERISWKQWKYLPCFLALALLPYIFINDPYYSLFVDVLLGLGLANLFYYYFTTDGTAPSELIPLFATAFLLTLIKEIGIALAVLAIFVFACDLWLCRSKTRRSAGLIRLAAVLAGALLAFASWQLFQTLSGVAGSSLGNNAWIGIQKLFAGSAPQYQYDVIKSYILRLLAYDSPSSFTTIVSMVSMSVLLLIFGFVGSKLFFEGNAKSIWVLIGSLFSIYIIYAVALLGMYIFHFTQSEAIRFGSYDRYMGAVVMGIFSFLSMLLFRTLSYQRKWKGLAIMLLSVIMFVPSIVAIAFSYTIDRAALEQRQRTVLPHL